MKHIHELTVDYDCWIQDALVKINNNSHGAVFLLKQNKLHGIVTDGDIRRGLLNGANINDSVSSVANLKPVYASIENSFIEVQAMFNDRIKILPIVNEAGAVVDFATERNFHQIPLMKPDLNGNELAYVTDCINTGWVSSKGKYVTKFEEQFQKFLKSGRCIAVSNGTVALHLALITLGIGNGDEVLVPNLTFAATINAVIYAGAKPVLVDVDFPTMNLTLEHIKRSITSKTKAIILVHLYGMPCELSEIAAFCKDQKLLLIEDCAEALGSKCDGKYVGTYGDASIFSFFGNKTITTGEGGMVVLKNNADVDVALTLRDHGMSPDRRYWHSVVGYNYRMTNMQAAIGVAQLERIESFVSRKIKIANLYHQRLVKCNAFILPTATDRLVNTFWLYTILIKDFSLEDRDKLIDALMREGVETRPIFYPLDQMPPYRSYGDPKINFSGAYLASNSGICLPSSFGLKDEEISYICDRLIVNYNLIKNL